MSGDRRTPPPGGRAVRYETVPPGSRPRDAVPPVLTVGGLLRSRTFRRVVAALAGLGGLVLLVARLDATPGGQVLSTDGRATVVVFATAVVLWVFTGVDDTYVALGAATALVLLGVVSTEQLFATLGDETVWLLLAAFVVAAGVTASGLATRAAAFVVTGAGTPRQLAHLLTGAIVVTTFMVPSTSGRAALVLPVFLGLASALPGRPQLVRAIALLCPTVILVSAVGSLIGAGAHLVTSQVVLTATGSGFDFVEWLLLGLPLAVVASHLAAELVLLLFTSRAERRRGLRVGADELARGSGTPVTGPLSVAESRALLVLVVVVVLWCTEPLHRVHPAVVALVGALVVTSPRYGAVDLTKALKSGPWSLLLFMAATLALGTALTASGAAQWLGALVFSSAPADSPVPFLAVVVVVSTAAHLVIQSRTARSSVLVPIVVALAPAAGVDIAAAAFASTAAAGFCLTLTSSAKPVAIFAGVEDRPTFGPRDLLRLSAVLAPVHALLVLGFSLAVWPLLGLPY